MREPAPHRAGATGDPSARGVLIIVGALEERGGLQLRARELARHLVADRPVTVLTWTAGPRMRREADDSGVLVVRVPALMSWARDGRAAAARANTLVSVAAGVGAAWTLRRRWSTVWAFGLVPEGLTGALAAGALRRRCVIDTWLPGPAGNVARLRASPVFALERRVLGRAALVASTAEMVEELVEAGFAPGRVRLVPWGVDVGHFRPPSGEERRRARRALGLPDGCGLCVYTGRFDLRQKRLDVLIDAWRASPLPGWRLVLAGDGPDREALRAQAAGLRGVSVLGWRADVRSLLWAADAFVLPTEFETTGRAMVEALACGLAGVVSATTGYRQMAPAGVALVPNEPAAWERGLASLADPACRERQGRAGRRWVLATHDITQTMATVRSLLSGEDSAPGRWRTHSAPATRSARGRVKRRGFG